MSAISCESEGENDPTHKRHFSFHPEENKQT